MDSSLLLVILVLVPFLGGLLCIPLSNYFAKWAALFVSLVGTILSVVLFLQFDSAQSHQMQFLFSVPWFSVFHFSLGVDGISFPLIMLTKWIMPIAILSSWAETRHTRAFMICYQFLDAAITGTFLATDLFLFYIFWEVMLVPMILLIGVWGSKDRIYASLKFFLFTFAGSIFLLVAILFLFQEHYVQFGKYTAHIADFYKLNWSLQMQNIQMHSVSGLQSFFGLEVSHLVFLGLTLAFLVKIPLFPFHTWLPDAHVQAPTGGSIILAAVLLKLGTYGLMRFSIPITPQAFIYFIPYLATLSLVGIVYGAWVAYQQTDMKKLIAYSSVSHLGFVVLGLCTVNNAGLTGAVLQSVNHGFSTGALFLLVGVLYERRHSRLFSSFGGLAASMPWYAVALVFVSCASMGVPGLNGFVGEFLVLLGSYEANPMWCAVAVLGVFFGALYMLVLLKKVLFGPVVLAQNKNLPDLSLRDWAGFIPLALGIIILGVQPNFLLYKVKSSLDSYWITSLKAKERIDSGLTQASYIEREELQVNKEHKTAQENAKKSAQESVGISE